MDMKSVLQSSYFFINGGFIVASDPILASHPSGGLREVISEYQSLSLKSHKSITNCFIYILINIQVNLYP
ncbi:hypothetical protein DN155_19725 [Salmonella enterica subsp. enterica serovar Afula]|nr:hypothetical protein [Salmonella enterica subsp. enterica serovar Afula]